MNNCWHYSIFYGSIKKITDSIIWNTGYIYNSLFVFTVLHFIFFFLHELNAMELIWSQQKPHMKHLSFCPAWLALPMLKGLPVQQNALIEFTNVPCKPARKRLFFFFERLTLKPFMWDVMCPMAWSDRLHQVPWQVYKSSARKLAL